MDFGFKHAQSRRCRKYFLQLLVQKEGSLVFLILDGHKQKAKAKAKKAFI